MSRPKNFFKKYHYVYIITNNINGKQYIGDHTTDNLEDNYMGSGKLLHEAYKKHGKNNFSKKILENFDSRYEAFKAQKKYIKKYDTLYPNGYNLHKSGGRDPLRFDNSPEKLKEYLEDLKTTSFSPNNQPSLKIEIKNNNFKSNVEHLKKNIEYYNSRGCIVPIKTT